MKAVEYIFIGNEISFFMNLNVITKKQQRIMLSKEAFDFIHCIEVRRGYMISSSAVQRVEK